MTSENKIQALKAAGIDVTNFFAINEVGKNGKLFRADPNTHVATEVDDNDPIFSKIVEAGVIPNPRLYRRWVTSQVFRILASGSSMERYVERLGTKYAWKVLLEELRIQAKLYDVDQESYKERNRFFNFGVACALVGDHCIKVFYEMEYIKNRFSGRSGCEVSFHGQRLRVEDLRTTVYNPFREGVADICGLSNPTPKKLYEAVNEYYKMDKKPSGYRIDIQAFLRAYVAAGCYFTAKNLILFHGCRAVKNGAKLSVTGSLKHICTLFTTDKSCGQLESRLRDFLVSNCINIEEKMAEWRANKKQKFTTMAF